MEKKKLKLSTILIYAVSLFNLLWIAGIFLNPSLSWINQFASFYASSCEQNFMFFRIIDMAFFVFAIAWLVVSWKKYNKLFLIAMFSIAVATLGDSLFPPGCLKAGAGHPSFASDLAHIHSYTSAVGFFAMFFIVTFVARRLFILGFHKKLVVIIYIINLLLLLQYNYQVFFPNTSWVGLTQRAIIILFSAWLLLVPLVNDDKK